MLLINSNVKHNLSENSYNNRRTSCENVAKILDIPSLRHATIELLKKFEAQISIEDYEKAVYVIQENERVLKAVKALQHKDFSYFGKLLYESHKGLKENYKVSCEELDFLVEIAKKNPNLLGARMVGGGFGGCTLNVVKGEKIEDFITNTSIAFKKKFHKECTPIQIRISEGTKVVNL